ncbi:MAG: trehalose-6-phosphate synthase [Acidobacteria bacterium]|nr:MAG: trehalose-6-phosphate synthase [Acidobacteriota bacterium]PYX65417.1 MAG: trehalose-6-phosphate synthase [Acidobacteriota bacterium]
MSLIVGITLVSLAFSYYEVRSEKRGLTRDLERRAEVLAESLAGNIEPHLAKGSQKELQRIVERFGNRQHLDGVAIYNQKGAPIAVTTGLAHRLPDQPVVVAQAVSKGQGGGQFVHLDHSYVHIYAWPLHQQDQIVGALAIVHDASYIKAQTIQIWRESFLRDLVLVLLISSITLLIVRWSIVGPIAKAAQWMKALRTGKGSVTAAVPDIDLLRPLAREVETFARSLSAARSAAEKEAQLRDAAESNWTAERLSVHVRNRLAESRLFVVSNREPYSHTRRGRSLEVVVPPSGLVTALEPILRACDGTWVAHGSGDADQETVDKHDSLRVPPEDPRYTLRRVWLSKQEEEGYYFGFANEGLWPLCHVAHVRPLFRASDWEHYLHVNQKFADAVLEEMAGTEHPFLLAQDYHFALLPRMIKKKRPDARIAIFWHIPWANPEKFSICPWQRQLVDGLLGADLVGFHIHSDCNNFLQTVDRTLESRIDWDHFAVEREDHRTIVKPFPISVAFDEIQGDGVGKESIYTEKTALLRELGVNTLFLGVGVDRVDYTKGIQERFRAIERLLEKYPDYLGKFTFVQIGAPSRTHIKRYHDLLGEVEAEADRINWRFQTGKWRPIIFLNRQHSHKEIQRFYRTADLCMVTSLHDGMNLVAKEFLAAREDEQGVLVLSQFTGAARELRDALIVNPYDVEQVADAIRFALEMEPDDRQNRMQRMRKVVKENNVYRWAGNLITELSEIRVEKPGHSEANGNRVASAI